MEIIYLIILCILFISTILVKKSEKKQNVLFWIILTSVILLSYNLLCGFLLLLLKLNITLITLSVINLIISVILILKIYKDKEIQKYYIKIKDIIVLLILLVTIGIIAYKQYGFPFVVKYETTDPAVHFSAAKELYQEKTLKWNSSMPGASLNTAILFDLFDNVVSEQDFYCLYIIFDLIILYLIVAMFYIGIVNKENSIPRTIIAFIFSLLFVCGYPLNSMLFGFAYLSVGILIMTAIIVFAPYITNKELKNIPLCIYMFLLAFGIFFSYYFFAPIIYVSIGLYMLFDMIKNRSKKNILSIFTKGNIIKVIVILILPTLIGLSYFVLPSMLQTGETAVSSISAEGFMYRDLYSNFVYLVPFVLFFCVDKIKNKKNCFTNITFIVTTLFTVLLLYMGLKGKVSSYYYYKSYFLISILVMVMSVKSIYKLMDNKVQLYAYSYLFIYILLIIASISGIDGKITKINMLFNPNNFLNAYSNLYTFNYQTVTNDKHILSEGQLKAIDFIKSKEQDRTKIETYGNFLQMMWSSNVGQITESDDMYLLQFPVELDVNKWLEDKEKQYYVCFNVNEQINEESDSYDVIYEDTDVIILEKN